MMKHAGALSAAVGGLAEIDFGKHNNAADNNNHILFSDKDMAA
jgi:hypothetical protein